MRGAHFDPVRMRTWFSAVRCSIYALTLTPISEFFSASSAVQMYYKCVVLMRGVGWYTYFLVLLISTQILGDSLSFRQILHVELLTIFFSQCSSAANLGTNAIL